ncbi:MAG: sugar transferase [Nanoarchaeota archaeon]
MIKNTEKNSRRCLVASRTELAYPSRGLAEIVDPFSSEFNEIYTESESANIPLETRRLETQIIDFPQDSAKPWHSYNPNRILVDNSLRNMSKYETGYATQKKESYTKLSYDDIREMVYLYKTTKTPVKKIIENKGVSSSTFYRMINRLIDSDIDPELKKRQPRTRKTPTEILDSYITVPYSTTINTESKETINTKPEEYIDSSLESSLNQAQDYRPIELLSKKLDYSEGIALVAEELRWEKEFFNKNGRYLNLEEASDFSAFTEHWNRINTGLKPVEIKNLLNYLNKTDYNTKLQEEVAKELPANLQFEYSPFLSELEKRRTVISNYKDLEEMSNIHEQPASVITPSQEKSKINAPGWFKRTVSSLKNNYRRLKSKPKRLRLEDYVISTSQIQDFAASIRKEKEDENSVQIQNPHLEAIRELLVRANKNNSESLTQDALVNELDEIIQEKEKNNNQAYSLLTQEIRDWYKGHIVDINRYTKRAFDLSVLTATSPLWVPSLALLTLGIGTAIKAEEVYDNLHLGPIKALKSGLKAPVFYKQKVIVNHKETTMRKFRSMNQNAHKQFEETRKQGFVNPGANYKNPNDPRITRVGKIIRKFSLDELTQIINVLKGDMWMVGGQRPQHQKAIDALPVEFQNIFMDGTAGVTTRFQAYRGTDKCPSETECALDYHRKFHEKFMLPEDLVTLLRTPYSMIMGRNC